MKEKSDSIERDWYKLLKSWIDDEKKASREYASYISINPFFSVMAQQEINHHNFLVKIANDIAITQLPILKVEEEKQRSIRELLNRLDYLIEDETKASKEYAKHSVLNKHFLVLSAEESTHGLFLETFRESYGDKHAKLTVVWEGSSRNKTKIVDMSNLPQGEYTYLRPEQDVKDIGEKGYSNLSEIEGTIREIFQDYDNKLYGDKTALEMYKRLRKLGLITYQSTKGELKEKANKEKAWKMINQAIDKLNKLANKDYKPFIISEAKLEAKFKQSSDYHLTQEVIFDIANAPNINRVGVTSFLSKIDTEEMSFEESVILLKKERKSKKWNTKTYNAIIFGLMILFKDLTDVLNEPFEEIKSISTNNDSIAYTLKNQMELMRFLKEVQPDSEYDPIELKLGIKMEKIHANQNLSNDFKEYIAKILAKHNLDMLVDYYSKIKPIIAPKKTKETK